MKCGIDYFPLDVTLDEKIELIEAQFGLTGFAVIVKLLQKIYGGEGYYAEWTNEIALLFARKIGANGNAVSDIVSAAVKRGIFDKTLYDKYQILTSKGIQKRYFEAVSRRKNVEVKGAYLLIDVTVFSKNVHILGENVNIFNKNADIFQQSKVEESRVKESKEKKCDARTREDTPMERFLNRWGVNSNALGNYSGGRLAGIDWEKVSAKVERSSFLKQQKAISFFIEHYEDVLDGKYDDFGKARPRSGFTEEETEAKKREYDELMRRTYGGA